MPQVKRHSKIATTYARSLLELAGEAGTAVSVGVDAKGLRQILSETPTFAEFLSDPTVSAQSRGTTLRSIFGGRIQPLLLTVILLMNQKRRLRHLQDLCSAYEALLDESLGRVNVDVTVAEQLDPTAIEEVRNRINQALKKDAVLRQRVDESIIGGLILRIGDRLIDGSVKTQLKKLSESMLVPAVASRTPSTNSTPHSTL